MIKRFVFSAVLVSTVFSGTSYAQFQPKNVIKCDVMSDSGKTEGELEFDRIDPKITFVHGTSATIIFDKTHAGTHSITLDQCQTNNTAPTSGNGELRYHFQYSCKNAEDGALDIRLDGPRNGKMIKHTRPGDLRVEFISELSLEHCR